MIRSAMKKERTLLWQFYLIKCHTQSLEGTSLQLNIRELLSINKDNNAPEPPSLAPLINEFSYLIFAILGFEEERLRDWLTLPLWNWDTQTYYKKFVHRYTKEEEKQKRLLTVDRVRFAMKEPGKKSTNMTKQRLTTCMETLSKKSKLDSFSLE